MEKQQIIYYPMGLSGMDYLSLQETVYYHSQVLPHGIIRLIECDNQEKSMKVKTRGRDTSEWNEMQLNELQKEDIVDLNENGERWEGDSLNHIPFGYGFIYNSENQIVYEGFVYGEMKVCFGTEFYGDVGSVEYVGNYYRNKRNGYGQLYDKKNELIYEGEWFNDDIFDISNTRIVVNDVITEELIHYGIEELIIGNDYKITMDFFVLNQFAKLKRVIIGENCFNEVREFRIENCNELIELKIGDVVKKYNNEESDDLYNNPSSFSIKNCDHLNEILIGDNELMSINEVELTSRIEYSLLNE